MTRKPYQKHSSRLKALVPVSAALEDRGVGLVFSTKELKPLK
jgi:hypothetical protein